MTAKGAAIAAALIFILICAILPASAGTVTYDKKTVAVSAESPLTLKKSTKHMFTVVPAEGEQTLVFDLSSRPDSVIIKHGSATVATFKPEAPQFTADAGGYGGEKLTVYLKYKNKTALTVYALDSLSDISGATLWNPDVSGVPVCLCATLEDAEKAFSQQDQPCRYVIFQKTGEEDADSFRHRVYEAGVNVCPEFLGLKAYESGKATEKSLEKDWNTDKIFRRLVTLVRLSASDTVIFCAEDEIPAAFLTKLSGKIAASAADPDFSGDNVTDQYLNAVSGIRDALTGEILETDIPSVAEIANAAWPAPAGDNGSSGSGPETDLFLPEGEEPVTVRDPDSGTWIYLSQDLHIVITRYTEKKPALVWYEADIRVREGSDEYLRTVAFSNGKANKPDKLYDETGIVFGINTDFYQYRKNYKIQIGLIMRQGKVIYELENAKNRRNQFPPLDTLMLTPDGGFELKTAGELTADEALSAGASDVLSFGPILVLDGRLRIHSPKIGAAKEPRTAIGWLGDRHYLAVTVEGRLKRSEGISMTALGQLMLARGCTQAINLDGGHTSVMMFMGERLNTIGSFKGSGATSGSRNLFELLGVGAEQ